jgi:hypothetical protein
MRRRPSWAALAWVPWALTLVGLAATAWLDHLLRRAGMPELTWFQSAGIADVVAAVSAATVGAVLASRRPAHPVGWLLLGLGLSLAVAAVVYAYVRYGLVARPGALPAAGYLAGLSNGMILIWVSCVGFVLLLTPTGSLPSPRWRWWARVAAAAPVVWVLASVVDPAPMRPEYPTIGNPLAVPVLPRVVLDAATGVAALVVVAALLVGAASLVSRFRRARGTERLQLRWLALAAALAATALLVALAALVLDAGWDVFNPALGVCLGLLPLATGAAILRYRLYDLDASSAAPSPTGCSPSCSASATPPWSWAWANCWAATPPWWSPPPPWWSPPRSSPPAAASSRPSTAASTAAATTPPRRSRRSAPGCGSRSTWTP